MVIFCDLPYDIHRFIIGCLAPKLQFRLIYTCRALYDAHITYVTYNSLRSCILREQNPEKYIFRFACQRRTLLGTSMTKDGHDIDGHDMQILRYCWGVDEFPSSLPSGVFIISDVTYSSSFTMSNDRSGIQLHILPLLYGVSEAFDQNELHLDGNDMALEFDEVQSALQHGGENDTVRRMGLVNGFHEPRWPQIINWRSWQIQRFRFCTATAQDIREILLNDCHMCYGSRQTCACCLTAVGWPECFAMHGSNIPCPLCIGYTAAKKRKNLMERWQEWRDFENEDIAPPEWKICPGLNDFHTEFIQERGSSVTLRVKHEEVTQRRWKEGLETKKLLLSSSSP